MRILGDAPARRNLSPASAPISKPEAVPGGEPHPRSRVLRDAPARRNTSRANDLNCQPVTVPGGGKNRLGDAKSALLPRGATAGAAASGRLTLRSAPESAPETTTGRACSY